MMLLWSFKSRYCKGHRLEYLWQWKREWKPFRIALDKKERKKFERCLILLNSTSLLAPIPVSLYHFISIVISILFHNYKEPKECISGVERIVAKVNTKKNNKNVILACICQSLVAPLTYLYHTIPG